MWNWRWVGGGGGGRESGKEKEEKGRRKTKINRKRDGIESEGILERIKYTIIIIHCLK